MQNVEKLSNINQPICQGMLDNFVTDEEETSSKSEVILQNDIENTKANAWD